MESEENDEWVAQHRSESPLLSPISDLDSDYVAYRKAQLASRRLERYVLQWQRLFPQAQWPLSKRLAARILLEPCTLCFIVPFLTRITNLDGKVWQHRYWFDKEKNEWHSCDESNCIRFVVRECRCPAWRVERASSA